LAIRTEEAQMIGTSYRLFGTTTVFTITGEQDGYWLIAVKSPTGAELGVRITKVDLSDGVIAGSLQKL
jgi:hypothetical protein